MVKFRGFAGVGVMCEDGRIARNGETKDEDGVKDLRTELE